MTYRPEKYEGTGNTDDAYAGGYNDGHEDGVDEGWDAGYRDAHQEFEARARTSKGDK